MTGMKSFFRQISHLYLDGAALARPTVDVQQCSNQLNSLAHICHAATPACGGDGGFETATGILHPNLQTPVLKRQAQMCFRSLRVLEDVVECFLYHHEYIMSYFGRELYGR